MDRRTMGEWRAGKTAGCAGPRPSLSRAVVRLREAPEGASSGRLYRTPVFAVELLAAPTPGGRRGSSPRERRRRRTPGRAGLDARERLEFDGTMA